jgi:phosphoribosylanthranilate isomerase
VNLKEIRKMWDFNRKYTRIKLCEFESLDAAYEASQMGADALGFHFFKTHSFEPRLNLFKAIFRYLPQGAENTLLSDIEFSDLKAVLGVLPISTLQLCPDWSVEMIRDLRKCFPDLRILKVMSAQSLENNPSDDDAFIKKYEKDVDGFLLDSHRIGGTGKVSDWPHCADIVRKSALPVFLAGGLNRENVEEAIRVVKPFGVDVENGVSIRLPGGPLVKSMKKCQEFIAAVKLADSRIEMS